MIKFVYGSKGNKWEEGKPSNKRNKIYESFFLLKYLNILLKLSELKMFIKIY